MTDPETPAHHSFAEAASRSGSTTGGKWYLSSIPARRGWYRNLRVDPRFTFHLKHGVQADLAATAIPVPDPDERRRIFQHIVDDFNQPHNPAIVRQPQHVEDWIEGSPLLEIVFDDRP